RRKLFALGAKQPNQLCQTTHVTDRLRYARNGSVHLAYRVFGEGEPTIVTVPGWFAGNVDNIDDPHGPFSSGLKTLAREMRVVVFDRRGTGVSDPAPEGLSIDERIDDLRAVMDAVGIARATFFAGDEGATTALLFAATHPERVRSL